MKGRKRAQSSKRGRSPVPSTRRVYSFWMFCAQRILSEPKSVELREVAALPVSCQPLSGGC